MPKDDLLYIDAGELPPQQDIAVFMHDDQTWYLYIDGEKVSLPKIISQLQKMQEYLNRSLSNA